MTRLSTGFNSNVDIVITKGLHPPWNYGEAVAMRNIVLTLKLIRKGNVIIYSWVDKRRFKGRYLEGVHYIDVDDSLNYTSLTLNSILNRILRTCNGTILLHLSGIKEYVAYVLVKLYKVFDPYVKARNILYDFGPIPVRWRKVPRSLHLTIDGGIGQILTTSILTYNRYGKHIRMHYLPIPYVPPEELSEVVEVVKGDEDEICHTSRDVNHIYIGYIGHLYEDRFPFKLVLKALYKLVNYMGFRDLVLKVVAPEMEYNLKVSKIIENYARKLNLEKNISIAVKDISEGHKLKLLKSLEIFLFTPIKQPVTMDPPMSVIEAMALGVPVIATEYLSLKYFIKDGINGTIINSLNSVNVLSEKIKMILKNDYLRKQIAENAQKYIFSKHYYKYVARILGEYLENVEINKP
uniref:Glycosyltransferase n=1 Tax=Ignisphaera aggregans TaxID=334771 RepID=A0A7J3YTF0_9CREN